jgi:hypothetical protein
VKKLNSDELHEAIHRALDEVERRLKSGELDGSGRFQTDEELAAGAATGTKSKPQRRIGPLASRPEKRRSAVSG